MYKRKKSKKDTKTFQISYNFFEKQRGKFKY